MSSRRERRANPDDWFELTGYAFQDATAISVPEEVRSHVRGLIEDILVVQLPAGLSQQQAHHIMRSWMDGMKAMGLEKVLIVPADTKLVSFRKVSAEKAKRLERDRRVKEVVRDVEDQKAREKESKSS